MFVCTLLFAIIGGLLIALSFDLLTLQNITDLLQQMFQFQNIHLFIGGFGLFLVIASIFTAQISLGKMQREKTIAFNNPDGQVTVSLSAIEDFVRKLASNMSEIRDLRSNVIAGKKGVEINIRVSLWADTNIPESTESIQGIIKNRIQQMLGIEEPIVVKVFVTKIVQKDKKKIKKKEAVEEISPFQGNIKYGKE